MNLVLDKNNNSHRMLRNDTKKNYRGHNIQKTASNSIAFGSDPTRFIAKHAGHVTTYTNFNIVERTINRALGNNFFTEVLDNARLTREAGELKLKDSSLFEDIYRTIRYPFFDLWINTADNFSRKFKDTPYFKGICEKIRTSEFIQQKVAENKSYLSLQTARNILENFTNCSTDGNIERTGRVFLERSADGITKMAKNYATRDERTLNRMATSAVSALYSASDFYNITMLQKDDKKESQKAGNGRFKQEITRMALSAGLTFLTLGALDKYAKRNIKINAAIIAGSTLVSEVVSRIFNKIPLVPLSPKEAEKIAKKRNNKNQNTQTQTKQNQVNFKGSTTPEALFVKFAQKDGSLAPLNSLKNQAIKEAQENNQKNNKPKKNNKLLKTFGIVALVANVLYFALKGKNGEFVAKAAKRDLYFGNSGKNAQAIKDFLDGNVPELDKGIAKTLEDINQAQGETADKSFAFLKKIKKFITKKPEQIDLAKLREEVTNLLEFADETQKPMLNQYLSDINNVIESTKKTKLTAEVKRTFGSGIYEGITRIINTIYQIITIPAMTLNSLFGKIKYGKSEKQMKELEKKLSMISRAKPKDVLAELNRIINSDVSNKEKIEQIFKNVRNIETKAETGELANLSRTMVTAISTYFFVNDYRNKVLIESEGKDVQKANEERNDRLAHKAANFVINGTLMNLFNSVFKTQLNNSLAQATLIAASTEVTNEFLVRKSICQPILPKSSKQEILDYEEKRVNKKGVFGAWARLFRKITGKKTLTQKAGINSANNSNKPKEDKKVS